MVAFKTKYEDPYIRFKDLEGGDEHKTYDITAPPADRFSVYNHCVPILTIKYIMVTFSLIVCLDGFFRGVYVQIETDILFKKFLDRVHQAEELEQLTSCLQLIRNLFMVTFLMLSGWLSFAITEMNQDFLLF